MTIRDTPFGMRMRSGIPFEEAMKGQFKKELKRQQDVMLSLLFDARAKAAENADKGPRPKSLGPPEHSFQYEKTGALGNAVVVDTKIGDVNFQKKGERIIYGNIVYYPSRTGDVAYGTYMELGYVPILPSGERRPFVQYPWLKPAIEEVITPKAFAQAMIDEAKYLKGGKHMRHAQFHFQGRKRVDSLEELY